jgi:drug/metabolite transporter (DMT)-like permease
MKASRSGNCPIFFMLVDKSKSNFNGGAHLALIAVQVLFATFQVIGKLALKTVPPFALVGLRIGGSCLLLLALARLSGNFRFIARKDWPLLLVSSALGLIFNQWLFVKGLSMSTASNAALISTSIPVTTLLVGIFIRTDRPTWRRFLGIALATAGVIWLIDPSRGDFSAANRVGDLLLVASAICYGCYIAVSKDLIKRYGALNVITWIFIVGAVAAIPPAVVSLRQISLNSISLQVWLELIYIIAMGTAAAYFLNAWALARVPPSTVAVYIYLQPLLVFALASFFLRESLGTRAIISTLLIFAGVFLVTRRSFKQTEQPGALVR